MISITNAITGAGDYTVELRSPSSSTVTGGTHAFTEGATAGEYFAIPTGAAAGSYRPVIKKGSDIVAYPDGLFHWDGSAEITPKTLESGLQKTGSTLSEIWT